MAMFFMVNSIMVVGMAMAFIAGQMAIYGTDDIRTAIVTDMVCL